MLTLQRLGSVFSANASEAGERFQYERFRGWGAFSVLTLQRLGSVFSTNTSEAGERFQC